MAVAIAGEWHDLRAEHARRQASGRREVGFERTPQGAEALRVLVADLTDVQVREPGETGGDWYTMEGYAAVYETETVLVDTPYLRIREEVARDALSPVLARDPLVHLNLSHQMATAMASTGVKSGRGSLELASDFHGLRFHARVPRDYPVAADVAPRMRDGVINQASFAFTIRREKLVESEQNDAGMWDDLWRIEEVGELYDVCVCPQGAYSTTESHLRTLRVAMFGSPGREPGAPQGRSATDGTEGPEPSQVEAERAAALEAEARAAEETRRRSVELASRRADQRHRAFANGLPRRGT